VEGEPLADPQAGAPEQHDQRSKSVAIGSHANRAHDRDDLLDRRRVGGVLLALVAWRTAAVIARHRRRRAPVAGGIQKHGFHESSLGGVKLMMCCYSNGPPTTQTARLLELRGRSPPRPRNAGATEKRGTDPLSGIAGLIAARPAFCRFRGIRADHDDDERSEPAERRGAGEYGVSQPGQAARLCFSHS
jgi:hypothetical protein